MNLEPGFDTATLQGPHGYADLFTKTFYQKRNSSITRIPPHYLRLGMRTVEGTEGAYVVSGGRRMLNLSSNNYLGLAGDPRLSGEGMRAIDRWGNSTSGSRLLNGTNELHLELEHALKEFKQVEAVVVFQSGYMANLGALSALLSKDDVVIIDKLVHASVIDGCKLAGAQVRMFKHQDFRGLERILQEADPNVGKLVIVDGIYSMDGDFVDLPRLTEIARRYGARVMVDDAHATGVAGPEGRGTANHFDQAEPDIVTGTLSKAFGCFGGFVAARHEVIEFIKYNSRAFIFSTSLCPSVTAALLQAINIARAEPERRENLWACTHYLLDGLKSLGFDTGVSQTPIIPIILDDESKMFEMVQGLDDDHIFASPVVYPACPRNAPRVRMSLSADHTLAEMDRLLDSLSRHGRALGLLN